jgi:hypothetical protein
VYVSGLPCNLLKCWTLLAAARDRAYQLLAHGRWFSLDTPPSVTTKTSRHDIAETLLKVWLSKSNQIKSHFWCFTMYSITRYWHILLVLHRVLYNYILTHISDDSSCTVQLCISTYFWCFIVYCTFIYWHIFLMFLRVLYNYILAYISDVSSCTLQLDTVRYFWWFIVYCTTRYWHLFLMFLHVLCNQILTDIYDSLSCTVKLDTGTYF